MITADCEHPEVAFRLMDLMCREDFTITARWGKQGENWDYVEDRTAKEVVTRIKYESADAQAEAELIANELTEYVYEKLSNWCLGVTDVEEEWDAYLEELEKIGLSDWLEICQAGWK